MSRGYSTDMKLCRKKDHFCVCNLHITIIALQSTEYYYLYKWGNQGSEQLTLPTHTVNGRAFAPWIQGCALTSLLDRLRSSCGEWAPLTWRFSCMAIPPQVTALPISVCPFCVVSRCANAAFLYYFLISGITPSTCSVSLMNKKFKQRVTVPNTWLPHPQICRPPAVEKPDALLFCRRSRTSGQDQQSPVTA